MDLVEITAEGIDQYSNEEIKDLREQLGEITTEEKRARENVINEWNRD